MRPLRSTIRRAAGALSLAAALTAFASPAGAAPSYEVKLGDDSSEVQLIRITATAGTYGLCFESACTADLAVDASAATIQSALNGLPTVGGAGGSVSVDGGGSDEGGGTTIVSFDGGSFAHKDVPQLVAANGATPLSGGSGGSRIMVRTLDPIGVSRSDERVDYVATVKNTGPDPTAGEVTLVVGLPAGQGTSVISTSSVAATGWACSTQPPEGAEPAKAICKRSDALAAGGTYPSVTVAAALGADAPDHAVATATASGGGAAASGSALDEFTFASPFSFGLQSAEGGLFKATGPPPFGDPYTQAGGHPFLGAATYAFTSKRRVVPFGNFRTARYRPLEYVKQVVADLPRGQVGNALAVPQLCPDASSLNTCPLASVVGGIELDFSDEVLRGVRIVAIEPEFGTPAQFAFATPGNVYTLTAHLRPEDNYAISLQLESAPIANLLDSTVILCNFGARLGGGIGGNGLSVCKDAADADANPKPLFTSPTRCDDQNPPVVRTRLNSWEHPDSFAELSFSTPPTTGCDQVPFEPEMSLKPTSNRADSPTGLDVEIRMPTAGLESKTGISQANLKRSRIVFPEGMSVNPSLSHGLGACSAAQVGIDPDTGVPNGDPSACPESSKIGSIRIATPVIQSTLSGDVYVARQGKDNPFDQNFAIYMVFDSLKDGIRIKLAGQVSPDPVTGQLTVTFDDNPEWPFSTVSVNFPQGPRAALINPPTCGTHEVRAELSPYSAVDPDNPTPAETVVQTTSFEVTEGPNGGPCPNYGLEPKLSAGTTNPTAGATSPFTMRLHREDGTQRFSGLTLSPPQGLSAYLKGIPYCPDYVLAAVSPVEETGQAQIDSPSCPVASLLGTASAGAGAGPNPFYVNTGRAYLAGPYKGAPISLALVTPAVAGPFDLGNVVVRTALHVNPKTAEISAVSDPIPLIWHGVLLDLRDIRVDIDRPGFILNPTSCAEKTLSAKVTGAGNDIASTGDDSTADVSNRFQVDGCADLAFKPRMTLRLRGGTKRGKHPALTATLEPGAGNANIANIAVALPRSEFLENAHIRTVCTRPDFAADNCPAGAIYGQATVWTPLLDEPLTGPVYLRSSDNLLPDLVPDLRGPETQPIKIESSGRTDSVNGGIRNTFDFVPDAPFTRFVLRMQGGKKGLLVNSRDICRRAYRATVSAGAHNGRTIVLKPKLQAPCRKAKKAKKPKRGR